MNLSLKQRHSTFLQDAAAGGIERRKIKIKSGDVVTISISVKAKGDQFQPTLRFKSGLTVQRSLDLVEADNSTEALRISWRNLRNSKYIEKQGWTWMFD